MSAAPAPGKTLVFQAWVGPRPSFLGRCLETVRAWAADSGFEYRLESDALLEGVPDWYRQRVDNAIVAMSNVGRLALIQRYLQEGYERVIWVDADVVIFAPAALRLSEVSEYALTHEVWSALTPAGGAFYEQRLTCSFMVFDRGNPFLDFFQHGLLLRASRRAPHLRVGTATMFLSQLDRVLPLPRIRSIGQFGPLLLADVGNGTQRFLPEYMRQVGTRLAGANLGTAFLKGRMDNVSLSLEMDEALFGRAIAALLDTRGEVLNRHLPAAASGATA